MEVIMMRDYSLDLRRHLVQAIQSGTSKAHAAEVFGVSVRTIGRSLKHLAETDRLKAKPIPGRPRQILPEQHADLTAQLRAHADATLTEQCASWAASHGIRISPSTMRRTLARLGWT
jgi:transposase